MESDPDKARLLAACGRILEPIVRFLMKGGITWKEFSELARSTFVQVATSDFGIKGRPTNASRVAILTGLDRRDVRRLRLALSKDASPAIGYMSKASQVLDAWHHDPEFIDAERKPRILPLEGDGPSVAKLVRRVAPGLPPGAMVKELKSAGAIAQLPDGNLQALQRSYIPRHVPEEQARLWGSVLRDLATTVGYNITRESRKPALFERRAINLRVDADALPEFRAFLEREGQQFLERIDDWLSAHAHNAATDRKTMRLGAGVYQIQDRPGEK